MRSQNTVALLWCVLACKTLVCSAQSAAVVGAGVHGILAAIELKHRDWNVTVFEKEADILPIVPSVNLDDINYEYYSQAIYSPVTYQGVGPNPSLVRFASAYNQTLPQPWTASAAQRALYYDTVTGPAPFPPVWAPFLESSEGGATVAQQLADAVNLLRKVDTNASIPANLLASGIAEANESILQWAQRVDLPAYAGITDVWWNAAACLLPQPLPAAVRLNMDLTSVGGLIRTAFLSLGLTDAQADELNVTQIIQDDGKQPTSFQYLPNGVRGLLEAALDAEGLSKSTVFNTPVSKVANDGTVSSQQGTKQYDAVIVTVRPEAAFAMLDPPLNQVYSGGVTGLVDVWIFNASIVARSPLAANLSGTFLTTVSQNGSLPQRDGTPIYIIRQDAALPFFSVGSYVDGTVTKAQSLARANSVLLDFGLKIASTAAYQRIPFPSQLAQPAKTDHFGHVYLLGEALSGIGLDVALPYIATQMNNWFGPTL